MAGKVLVRLQPLDDRRVVRRRPANASTANRRRVGSVIRPCSRSSSSTVSYWSGLVTTATCSWFLAAARTIAGPPMSISSIDGSVRNGYRFETTRSNDSMPCSAMSAWCFGFPGSASSPPWIRGWSVTTR